MMCTYLCVCVCVCVCVLYVCVSSVFQAPGIRKQKYVRQCSAVHLFYIPIVEESDFHLLSHPFFRSHSHFLFSRIHILIRIGRRVGVKFATSSRSFRRGVIMLSMLVTAGARPMQVL